MTTLMYTRVTVRQYSGYNSHSLCACELPTKYNGVVYDGRNAEALIAKWNTSQTPECPIKHYYTLVGVSEDSDKVGDIMTQNYLTFK